MWVWFEKDFLEAVLRKSFAFVSGRFAPEGLSR